MRRMKYTAGAWAMVMLLALMPAGCGKPLRATTMRLEKTEGTVRLTNQNGKKRTLKEDIRFTNGDVLRTREESYAGVSLDDTKAVMLDEESRAEFYQGKDEDWIEIDLVEGELFFNVEEKLSEDEEFEIHTSTMVMGIRGTSGHVRTQESGEDTLTVTDGTVHVTAAVPDSEDTMETDVSAGSQLRVIPADIAPSGHIEMEVRWPSGPFRRMRTFWTGSLRRPAGKRHGFSMRQAQSLPVPRKPRRRQKSLRNPGRKRRKPCPSTGISWIRLPPIIMTSARSGPREDTGMRW